LREHIKKGVFVVGAVEQAVTSAAETYQVPCQEIRLMFRQ
jgi:kinesin family protein 15